MQLPSELRDDLAVATAAALSAVALTLALEFGLSADSNYLLRMSPLSVYFVYLFVSKGPDARLTTSKPWVLLAVAVAVATFLFVAV